MDYVGYFNGTLQHSVDDYERERRQGEFARALHAAYFSPIRKGCQRPSTLVNCSHYAFCSGWVLLANVLKYAG